MSSATADAPLGLADLTAASYFSAYTLPGPFAAAHGAGSARLARPAPVVPARLSVMSANVPEGVALRDARGVCLARYTAVRADVTFSLDDECMLEQITAILPEVVAYATGLLDYLMRGNLVVSIIEGGKVQAAGATGPVELLAEDGRGVRTALAAGAAIPAGTVRVLALSVGVDGRGEPLVAVGDAPVK